MCEDEDKCTQNFDQKPDGCRHLLGDVGISGKEIVKKQSIEVEIKYDNTKIWILKQKHYSTKEHCKMMQ